nr:serine carboxypeptidase-like 13 [Quercus suber]
MLKQEVNNLENYLYYMELIAMGITWICSGLLLLILFLSSFATSRSIVKTPPGFDGDLPFKLETGYVGVGEMDDVQLFYYFVESQREPSSDPLLVWLTGGPGCSSFYPFFIGNGPLSFHYIFSERELPTLHLNSDTWTKRLNILYIDAPVGSGFSYSKSLEGYYSDDQKTVANLYNFLQRWLIDHPEFAENHLYLGGGSYTGILIPVTVQKMEPKASLAYTKNILSTIDYHRNLSRTNLRALIYCADLEMSIPHIATQEMIRSLNLTSDVSWRAWFVDAQVAGYTERYKNNDFYMTYSSVKGADHVAEEYKPKEVNTMIDRWLAYYPL